MKIEKKHIVVGLIGIVSIVAATLYYQYKKIMDYVIKFRAVKVKALNENLVNFDLFLSLENNSNISFDVVSQSYSIYINNRFVTEAKSNKEQTVISGMNIIPLNVSFNPKQVLQGANLQNVVAFFANTSNTEIRIDIKLHLRLFLIPISIPFVWKTTVKELLTENKK